MTETPPFRFSRTLVGALFAWIGHVVTIVAAYVAAALVHPSPGGGLQDVAAAAVTFLGGQLVLGLICFIVGTVLFVRGKRDSGIGVLAGWLVGLLLVVGYYTIFQG